jgi:UV DNA damage endonuclease
MKIGYPCINRALSCRSSRTFRLASYSDERMRSTIEENLNCLQQILEFNRDHDLLFFRITSDLIPFASHPICTFPWHKTFKKKFKAIGDFIKKHDMRVSMHPDQFVLINSLDDGIFQRSVAELIYHAEVLDLLGADATAKIQIHVGGIYGNKRKSMERFVKRFYLLPDAVKKRLVIENDERLYSVNDCLHIHQETNLPLVFDVFHFFCYNNGEGIREMFSEVCRTWSNTDGLPITDYSSQEKSKRKGSHGWILISCVKLKIKKKAP